MYIDMHIHIPSKKFENILNWLREILSYIMDTTIDLICSNFPSFNPKKYI